MKAYYFGCLDDAGHFMWMPGGRRAPREVSHHPYPGLPWNAVDGQFAPTLNGTRKQFRRVEAPQGQAELHHKDGWTALSFWDRSVDSRGASSSTFIFDAELDFDAALTASRENFPEVFERLSFDVVEWSSTGSR